MSHNPIQDPLTEGFCPIDQIGPDEYQSRYNIETNVFDPATPIDKRVGFGGGCVAFGISVAYSTVGKQYSLYSLYGSFLSPSTVQQRLRATIKPIRDTRNFATRRVDIFQDILGAARMIMAITLDFHVPDPSPVLVYSAPPTNSWTPPERSWTEADISAHAAKHGAPAAVIKMHDDPGCMGARRMRFDVRAPPESIGAQTLTGMWPFLRTSVDHLSMTEKTLIYYWKTKQRFETRAENTAALAWIFDGGAGAVPAGFGKLNFQKISSLASLDFCMRLYSSDIDASRWLLREEKTVVASEGRTFQEARIWDHSTGRMIASCSQQCILRAAASGKL